jgi:hypothetical protein
MTVFVPGRSSAGFFVTISFDLLQGSGHLIGSLEHPF